MRPWPGSSPRGRGKRDHTATPTRHHRLIPARAGKTFGVESCDRLAGAHPRAGGENAIVVGMVREGMGSSPRGRGKLSASRLVIGSTRLIPARAGKTTGTRPELAYTKAHPRAGGENSRPSGQVSRVSGSSPRGRGKRYARRRTVIRGRLIPARAGKTRRGRSQQLSCPAHPRAGGENQAGLDASLRAGGSSPRGRGKLVDEMDGCP